MELIDIKECTRCHKKLNDLKFGISMFIDTFRLRSDEEWEEVPNLSQESNEVLCYDCFLKLSDILEGMNIPEDGSNEPCSSNPYNKSYSDYHESEGTNCNCTSDGSADNKDTISESIKSQPGLCSSNSSERNIEGISNVINNKYSSYYELKKELKDTEVSDKTFYIVDSDIED